MQLAEKSSDALATKSVFCDCHISESARLIWNCSSVSTCKILPKQVFAQMLLNPTTKRRTEAS